MCFIFFFQAEDGIRASSVTGVQTCALPISRRCLVDLMTNAWKAGAQRIEVTVRVAEQPGAARPQTVLRVDDDGPGMPPGVLDNPATSLAVMAEHLRGYSGSLTFCARDEGGTR